MSLQQDTHVVVDMHAVLRMHRQHANSLSIRRVVLRVEGNVVLTFKKVLIRTFALLRAIGLVVIQSHHICVALDSARKAYTFEIQSSSQRLRRSQSQASGQGKSKLLQYFLARHKHCMVLFVPLHVVGLKTDISSMFADRLGFACVTSKFWQTASFKFEASCGKRCCYQTVALLPEHLRAIDFWHMYRRLCL